MDLAGLTFMFWPREAISGFGISKLAFGRMYPFSSIMTALIIETMPLAPSA